jgi:hypothetical protein
LREIEEDGVPKNVYTIYLVTNRHVFEHFEEAGAKSFVVGFNPESAEKGGVEISSLSLADDGERLWTAHPTEDVAVIPLNVALLKQQERHFEFLGSSRIFQRGLR